MALSGLHHPKTQCFFPLHWFPQAPQFRSSVSVDTQLPPQRVKPTSHSTAHWLPAQMALPWSGAGQTLPHAPQFLGSVLVSTQPALHSMKGLRQTKSQVPPAQLGAAWGGALQMLPQAPQFEVLLARLTHEPAQFVVPFGQLSRQLPWLHTSPVPHVLVHEPQWALSDPRSTHEPEQLV